MPRWFALHRLAFLLSSRILLRRKQTRAPWGRRLGRWCSASPQEVIPCWSMPILPPVASLAAMCVNTSVLALQATSLHGTSNSALCRCMRWKPRRAQRLGWPRPLLILPTLSTASIAPLRPSRPPRPLASSSYWAPLPTLCTRSNLRLLLSSKSALEGRPHPPSREIFFGLAREWRETTIRYPSHFVRVWPGVFCATAGVSSASISLS